MFVLSGALLSSHLHLCVYSLVGVYTTLLLRLKMLGRVKSTYLCLCEHIYIHLRSLSRNDIQILVGHGCPATDRKVVFSGKLLRKRVHLDEGDVSIFFICYNLRGLVILQLIIDTY